MGDDASRAIALSTSFRIDGRILKLDISAWLFSFYEFKIQ